MIRVLLLLAAVWLLVASVPFVLWLRFRWQWRQERPKARQQPVVLTRQAFMRDEFEADVLRDTAKL